MITTNSPWFDVHELDLTKAEGQPLLLNNLSYLNDPQFLAVDKDKSFIRGCGLRSKSRSNENYLQFGKVGNQGATNRGNIGWISTDSTTLDAQKAVRMCLDSVPMNSKKNLGTIYDTHSVDEPRYQGLHYSYDHLPGQIQYYIDPEMTNPFFSPLFPKNMKSLGAVYIDPMGSVSYDFRRASGNTCGPQQPQDCNDCDIGEFRDSQHHREDIQSSQMRSRNKHEFEPVFFNFTSRYSLGLGAGL
jgi:hypothetical protein